MTAESYTPHAFRGIAFLGNYLPRACGIATFTHDLATAVAAEAGSDQPVIVAAMNDVPAGYAYSNRVKFELRQDHQIDYSRAADFINFGHADVVSVQHEYGIYGGDYGSNILTFLGDLNRPAVVTCHTVLEKPLPEQREVLCEIAAHAKKLVVMSKRAVAFLDHGYGIPPHKVVYIPHGIHDVPFTDPSYYKDTFGVEGRRVLMTFGLLTPAKGIEFMIEALPAIVERHPKTTYVVIGATHPAFVRKEGESYRLSLQRRVRDLGLEHHVIFHPRFVEQEKLLEYLGAADIFVTPYLHEEQITSGVLSYAMGAGKAVVSTPYWHAEELLAEGRGRLVPFRDAAALGREINGLLDDEVLWSALRKRAYTHCRGMVWSAVARSYLRLFDEVRSDGPTGFPIASALRSPLAATTLPLPRLDHVLRLTDDTGPCRHARQTVPDWAHGYSLEIAAATLVAATKYHAIYSDPQALRLTETCLTLLQTLIGEGDCSGIAAGLDYQRQKRGAANPDEVGKALWALGYVVQRGPSHLTAVANDLFHQILPPAPFTSPIAASYAVLGASNYLLGFPGASAIKRFLIAQFAVIEDFVIAPEWIERWPGSDWPVAAQASCVVARTLDEDAPRAIGRRLVAQIIAATQNGTVFVGQSAGASQEELPITAATFIEAVGSSYWGNREPELLAVIRTAVDWFLGANRWKTALFDFSTCGCHDAITATGINRNQGAEPTVYFLLALLSLNHLIGRKPS